MRTLLPLGIAALIVIGAASAMAGTDFQCMSDCEQRGYMYNYCLSRCSYPDPIPAAPAITPMRPHGTDFKCMADCQQRGYMYSYCQQACSY